MANYMAVIEYDGAGYRGFQSQPGNVPTIEAELGKVFRKILGTEIKLSYSGRTDAGVHALYQVINFKFGGELDLYRFKWSVNCMLPADIGLKSIKEVGKSFDARRSAKHREYSYYVVNGNFQSVFLKKYSILVTHKLDLALMQEASKLFVGKKDFKAFSKADNQKNNTVREVFGLDIARSENNLIIFNIKGNSFLYNMVRIIVGTLLDLGKGNRSIDSIKEALEKKERSLSETPVPAKGLFLIKVSY